MSDKNANRGEKDIYAKEWHSKGNPEIVLDRLKGTQGKKENYYG